MKTRIIQNESEEPANGAPMVDATVSEPRHPRNVAARMGRWSASHKKTAIFGWLAFIAVAFLIGNAVGTKQLDQNKVGTGESGHVDSVLRDEFKQAQVDQILIQSTTKTVDDPAFRAAIGDVVRTVGGMKQVKKIESPFTAGNEERISNDRHTALVALELRTTDAKQATKLDKPVEQAIIAADGRHAGIAIEEFGVNAETQLDKVVKSDFTKAGLLSLPVTLIVLLVAFGALVATVLPAMLAALGDKVERLRIPFLQKRSRSGGDGRVWSAILDRVLRRPLVSIVVAGGLLLALAAPALHMHIAEPGIKTFPQNLSSIKTYNKLQKAFPGEANSSQVLVKTDNAHSAAVTTAISDLKRQAIATGQFSTPTHVDYSDDGTIAVVSLSMQGDGVDDKALTALQTLRHTIIPATVGKLDGADVGVTGNTAGQKDANGQMKHAAPFVFAFVLTLAFLLMLVTFRSVVVAIKAVLLNLLSVAAAYGALVLVFQDGWGKGLLGFVPPGGIISWLPIFLFVLLFGLSMDYHVFILSRVREAFDRGMSTEDAVAHGIKTTAGVVTSAALVMFGVFSIFATLQFRVLKEFGLGLAIAVLVDATIVRAVLLPATMKLLGDWNWYLPRWLEWLPRLEHTEPGEPGGAEPAPALDLVA